MPRRQQTLGRRRLQPNLINLPRTEYLAYMPFEPRRSLRVEKTSDNSDKRLIATADDRDEAVLRIELAQRQEQFSTMLHIRGDPHCIATARELLVHALLTTVIMRDALNSGAMATNCFHARDCQAKHQSNKSPRRVTQPAELPAKCAVNTVARSSAAYSSNQRRDARAFSGSSQKVLFQSGRNT